MMDAKRIFTCAAAILAAGCVPAPPPPDISIYHPRDPSLQMPGQYNHPQAAQREQSARFQQEASQMHERVRHHPDFGGFILRWSPEPHAVVMFTGDAAAKLRRYTSDPRYRAQSVELTLAELERMKDRMTEQLSRLGLGCFSVDGDEEHNSVTVGAPLDELARIRAAIAAGRIIAPRKLRLVEQGCASWR